MDYSTASIRNAEYTENGDIVLELDRDGTWIPFTASTDDVEPHGAVLHARAIAELSVAAYAAPTTEEVRANTVALRLDVVERMIADDPSNTSRTAELESWALQNQIPASAQAIFDALPLRDRAAAMRNENLQRSSPLIAPFAAVYGYTTDAQIDVLFGI